MMHKALLALAAIALAACGPKNTETAVVTSDTTTTRADTTGYSTGVRRDTTMRDTTMRDTTMMGRQDTSAMGQRDTSAMGRRDTSMMSGQRDTSGYSSSQRDTSSMSAGAAGAAGAMTFTLNAVSNSGASGNVMLTPSGSKTTVNLTVRMNPNDTSNAGSSTSTHAAHIHSGTCAAPGAIVAPLTSVEVQGGQGSSTSTVNLSSTTIMSSPHVVEVHSGNTKETAPIACADLSHGGMGGMGGMAKDSTSR